MHKVSVLFARADSVYRDLVFDVWDQVRDARKYAGPWPVVAHPPCRAWGKLRALAKPRFDEAELAFFAVEYVRRWGGVLEHPYGSRLWAAAGLPVPGLVDEYGGWTITIDQGWFGHEAPKPTWLYVVGMPRHHCPLLPVDQLRRRTGRTLDLLPADRERTPWLLADWLVRLAGRCHVQPARVVTPIDRARLPRAAAGCYSDQAAVVTLSQAGPLPPAPLAGYVDRPGGISCRCAVLNRALGAGMSGAGREPSGRALTNKSTSGAMLAGVGSMTRAPAVGSGNGGSRRQSGICRSLQWGGLARGGGACAEAARSAARFIKGTLNV